MVYISFGVAVCPWYGMARASTLIAIRQVQLYSVRCVLCDRIAAEKKVKLPIDGERKRQGETNYPMDTATGKIRQVHMRSELNRKLASPIGIYHCRNDICT